MSCTSLVDERDFMAQIRQSQTDPSSSPQSQHSQQSPQLPHHSATHIPSRVTIRAVAQEAGVAASTVSRAFSRPGRVSAETTRRIFAAAHKVGYRNKPISPLSMKNHFSNLIGVIVADLSNPVFADLMHAIQHECFSHNLGVLTLDSEESPAIERAAIRLATPHVDGLILGSTRLSDTQIRKLAQFTPTIAINRIVRGVRSLIADPTDGLQLAVNHLVSQGHHSLAYLSGPENSWQDGMRWRALSTICSTQHIALHRIPSHSPTFSGGYRCRDVFLRTHATAVIAYNDIMAIGFIAALHASGLSVPQDYSVIGIDDVQFSTLVTPALTTVRLPRHELGIRSADEIDALIHHTETQSDLRTVNLPSTLIVRASTGPVSLHRN
jgi:DNA-binding LacI/PurR family transcriptional regulator